MAIVKTVDYEITSLTKPRTIYVARHAHREDSINPSWAQRAQRPHDSPLSAVGHVQAEYLAKKLQTKEIDHIICSPLLRAVETAVYCARSLHLTVKVETGLSEWFNIPVFRGSQEIISITSLEEIFPEINADYLVNGPWPKAETKEDMQDRVSRTVRRLLKALPGNLLLISHGSPTVEIGRELTGETYEMLDIAKAYALKQNNYKFELAGIV